MNKLRDKKLLLIFGDNLRKLRKRNNMSLESLAYEADMELSQIFRIEKGIINPTLTTLNALAKALNISLENLLKF